MIASRLACPRFGPVLAILLSSLALAACSDDGDDGDGNRPSSSSTGGGGNAQAVIDNYAANVHANYEQVLTGVEALKNTVAAFVDAPTEPNMKTARDAWLASRPAYLQSEVYRFYNGPIDNAETGPEGKINGWPLDENFIDYTDLQPTAGIINDPDTFPEITTALIAEQNEAIDEKSLSAGFHAIEFLLWGEDLDENGPGARPASDYVTGPTGSADNQDRRGTYLQAVTDLLIADLQTVVAQWQPGTAYAAELTGDDPIASLTKMITGMGSLSGGELKNERINNAYQTKDQEEEHSCFSDNTHVDHLNDAIGIQNVYLGKFGGNDGAGLDELVKAVNPELDAQMKADLESAIAAIEAIPTPFDQAIVDEAAGGGREKIKAAIDALQKLTDTTVDVATALGVTLNVE
ncbi:MAG: imelysin family protein [Polyangiaceae bacterium]